MDANSVLPVVTLLLGAALSKLVNRRKERTDIAAEVAELERAMWTKGHDGDYVELKVHLAGIRVKLRAVGVPSVLVDQLADAVMAHWSALYDTQEPEIGWAADSAKYGRVHITQVRILIWLERPWNILARRRLLRLARLPISREIAIAHSAEQAEDPAE